MNEAPEGHARPEPKRADRTLRRVLVVLCGLVAALALAVVGALLFMSGNMTVDPSTVPAGTTYYTTVEASGARRSFVRCPGLVAWLGGEGDPYCDVQEGSLVLATGILLVLAAALVVIAVLLARSMRNARVAPAPPADPLLDG